MSRVFTRKEVEKLKEKNNVTIIIDNEVYCVAEFLEQHPGGEEVLMGQAGKDASACFRDVGHSEAAREWMVKWHAGRVPPEEERPALCAVKITPPPPPPPVTLQSLISAVAPPLALAALSILFYWYLF